MTFFSCRLVAIPIFPRHLSGVLSKFNHRKLILGRLSSPRGCHPGRPPSPPSDATDLPCRWLNSCVALHTSTASSSDVTERNSTKLCHMSGNDIYMYMALHHTRHHISEDTAKSIACSMIHGRLDYCNSVLYGTSAANLNKINAFRTPPRLS